MAERNFNPSQQGFQQQPPQGYPMRQPMPQQQWQGRPQQWQQGPQRGPVQAPPAPAPQGRHNPLAIAALICGVVAVVGSITSILGVFAGVAAIVLAIIAMRRARNGMTLAGLICGIVGIVLSVALFLSGWSVLQKFVFVPVNGDAPAADVEAPVLHEPISDRLPIVVEGGSDHTNICHFEVTRIWYDEGEIIVNFTIRNLTTPTDSVHMNYKVYVPDDVMWTVNGVQVRPETIYLNVEAGDTRDDWFYFTADTLDGLGIDSADDVYSIRGMMRVDMYVSGEVASSYDFDITL